MASIPVRAAASAACSFSRRSLLRLHTSRPTCTCGTGACRPDISARQRRPDTTSPTSGALHAARWSTTSCTSTDTKTNTSTSSSKGRTSRLPRAFLATLQSALPNLPISTNPYDLHRHGQGESFHPTIPPDAVLSPSTTQDVVTIVRLCVEHDVPIIPFGVGTSLEGHVAAVNGGVCLDMTKFDTIDLPLDDEKLPADGHVRVGAGVTRLNLNQALRHTGLQFMVDPGADATIGGMVACGASGTSAVRYGTMRDNILALECVLADGTVAKCGTYARKNSAGYDLVGLMVGSEGTLGIITSVVVKIHPIPENVAAAVCQFENLSDAANAVSNIRMCNIDVERCEMLDGPSIGAFNRYAKSRGYEGGGGGGGGGEMDLKPTLFLEFAGPSPESVDETIRMARSVCMDDHGASEFRSTSDESERRRLWSARHNLYYAAINSRPGATSALVTDACVPLSRFPYVVTATAADVEEMDVVGFNFGHAGDGNFHCILPLCEDDSKEYTDKVHRVNDNLIRRTIEAGGTCTGEHGVGYGKMGYLPKQYGEGGVEFMRKIKVALDPSNIMNPGKVVSV